MRTRPPLRLLKFACAAAFSAVFFCLLAIAQRLTPESPIQLYPNRESIGYFSEYSPSSSPILLGKTRQRQFVSVGAQFTRYLARTDAFAISYMAEVRPLIIWSDPVLKQVSISIPPQYDPPGTRTLKFKNPIPVLRTGPTVDMVNAYCLMAQNMIVHCPITYTSDYGRRWTYAGGISPVGFKLNLAPHHKLQPVLTGLGGFAVAARDLPMFDSSAFNFTFSFGAGFEWFSDQKHSYRLEYRYQHLSNDYTGATNPGTDSQVLQAAWSWGRR